MATSRGWVGAGAGIAAIELGAPGGARANRFLGRTPYFYAGGCQMNASAELSCCQQQFHGWKAECEVLIELIREAEPDANASRGYAGSARATTSTSLRATYARLERFERLMKEHPEWRP